jgi:hypothetical protein
MILLCDKWPSNQLRPKIIEWISSNDRKVLAENLLFDLKHALDTSVIETRTCHEFETLIANDTGGGNLT